MMSHERERIALGTVARAHPRPSGARLGDDERHRLLWRRLHPDLAATVARLLALPDPGPVPGPSSISV